MRTLQQALVVSGLVVVAGGAFAPSVKAQEQPVPTTTTVTSGPNDGTCGSSNAGGPNSTVTPQQCGNGIGVGVTTNPNTTSEASGNKLDNNSPSNATSSSGGNNLTTGPSSAQIDSAIKNAVSIDPKITNTADLKQQLQSDPTLVSKLNSSNKADQTQAVQSLNKNNLYNGSASNSSNGDQKTVIDDHSNHKTILDSGAAGTSTAGFSPAGAAACDGLVVPQGSSDLRGGINIFGLGGLNFGRTKPQVASDFKGMALAVQLCMDASNAKRLLQTDLGEFLMALSTDMSPKVFRLMIAKYSNLGYERSLTDLIKIYHENGENEKAVEAVYETLVKINAGLIRVQAAFPKKETAPVQQQVQAEKQKETQAQLEQQRQQQTVNVYIDGQKRTVVQH